MSKPKNNKSNSNTIALNKKARFEFELTDKIEAGIALLGWEVKSLRAGRIQLVDSYVDFHKSEAFLIGAHISPIQSISTHFVPDPQRTRKLLLNRRELNRLIEAVQQKGYTVVATAMYWKAHMVKVEIALAKGKQLHDKRESEKQRDWERQKQRLFQADNKH